MSKHWDRRRIAPIAKLLHALTLDTLLKLRVRNANELKSWRFPCEDGRVEWLVLDLVSNLRRKLFMNESVFTLEHFSIFTKTLSNTDCFISLATTNLTSLRFNVENAECIAPLSANNGQGHS